MSVPDAVALAGLLADERRRRVVAALVLGAATAADVRDATGLSAREVAEAAARLADGGLVVAGDDGVLVLVSAAFRAAAQAAAAAAGSAQAEEGGDKVLRAFLRDGRLVSIPTQHTKRLVVLDRLAQEFEPGRRYAEREVNAILRRFHDDTAALRRYLVDEGLLDRESGEYWRTGGSFEVT